MILVDIRVYYMSRTLGESCRDWTTALIGPVLLLASYLLNYLFIFAKYTVYITLMITKKIVMIILLAGTCHQICDIYARPVP